MTTEFEYSPNLGEKIARKGKKEYLLLLDIGSYRTSAICWPRGEEANGDPANYKKYMLSSKKSTNEEGFPSGLSKRAKDKNFIYRIASSNVLRRANSKSYADLIYSVKEDFASSFTIEDDKEETNFKAYIKVLLIEIFEQITSDEQGNLWNREEIPFISKINITIPDLFITNLRIGYIRSIYDVCHKFQNSKWSKILPKLEDKPDKNKVSDFVSITTDENGAGEIYFTKVMRELSTIDFSKEYDRAESIENIKQLFASTSQTNTKDLQFILCRLDIGGLTTDASATIITTELLESEGTIPKIIHKLQYKNSFSNRFAGKYYRSKEREGKEKWWNDESFLNETVRPDIVKIIKKQYEVVQQRQSEINGMYFIISGRPTQSEAVQKMLRRIILPTFNQHNLLLMKEHCIFLASTAINKSCLIFSTSKACPHMST